MEYSVISLLLFLIMLLYFKVADKYNIVDKPNHRSAHTEVTLRGGGIVFWFASLIYCLIYCPNQYLFLIGITLISGISFLDDIRSLPNKIRLFVHFISISIAFFSLNLFIQIPIWMVFLAYVFFIGTLNAYNFMDGINGITGFYSFVVLSSLLYVNEYIVYFIDNDFIIYPIVASLVFLFFNFRKKAKCFAGDVGSIGMGFWIVYLLLMIILKTNNVIWVFFLIVYGVDTGCTIFHRLYLRENIFEAHRHHFYQILCNDFKIQHRYVALAYGLLQLVASYIIVKCFEMNNYYVASVVVLFLLLIYSTKFYLLKKMKNV
ncbi:glycosyltransferase family 4 protein [Flavobacterium columnare]|uniref:Glycosyltransferase family 4 protein n=2 Tax=Flavobacterium columnare TaxID=996 RepID=A0A437UED9_9FLAO|nr:glycosyltransferase family 4 protein [Flavobacterium columnare]